jgi:hypothetical protein
MEPFDDKSVVANSKALVLSAGIADESHGLLGTLKPQS